MIKVPFRFHWFIKRQKICDTSDNISEIYKIKVDKLQEHRSISKHKEQRTVTKTHNPDHTVLHLLHLTSLTMHSSVVGKYL